MNTEVSSSQDMSLQRLKCLEGSLNPEKMLFIDTEGLDAALIGTIEVEGKTRAVYDYRLMKKAYYDNADPSLYDSEIERIELAEGMVNDAENLIMSPVKKESGLLPPLILFLSDGLSIEGEVEE